MVTRTASGHIDLNHLADSDTATQELLALITSSSEEAPNMKIDEFREAVRFAIRYNRRIDVKKILTSCLDLVANGEPRQQALAIAVIGQVVSLGDKVTDRGAAIVFKTPNSTKQTDWRNRAIEIVFEATAPEYHAQVRAIAVSTLTKLLPDCEDHRNHDKDLEPSVVFQVIEGVLPTFSDVLRTRDKRNTSTEEFRKAVTYLLERYVKYAQTLHHGDGGYAWGKKYNRPIVDRITAPLAHSLDDMATSSDAESRFLAEQYLRIFDDVHMPANVVRSALNALDHCGDDHPSYLVQSLIADSFYAIPDEVIAHLTTQLSDDSQPILARSRALALIDRLTSSRIDHISIGRSAVFRLLSDDGKSMDVWQVTSNDSSDFSEKGYGNRSKQKLLAKFYLETYLSVRDALLKALSEPQVEPHIVSKAMDMIDSDLGTTMLRLHDALPGERRENDEKLLVSIASTGWHGDSWHATGHGSERLASIVIALQSSRTFEAIVEQIGEISAETASTPIDPDVRRDFRRETALYWYVEAAGNIIEAKHEDGSTIFDAQTYVDALRGLKAKPGYFHSLSTGLDHLYEADIDVAEFEPAVAAAVDVPQSCMDALNFIKSTVEKATWVQSLPAITDKLNNLSVGRQGDSVVDSHRNQIRAVHEALRAMALANQDMSSTVKLLATDLTTPGTQKESPDVFARRRNAAYTLFVYAAAGVDVSEAIPAMVDLVAGEVGEDSPTFEGAVTEWALIVCSTKAELEQRVPTESLRRSRQFLHAPTIAESISWDVVQGQKNPLDVGPHSKRVRAKLVKAFDAAIPAADTLGLVTP